MTRREAMVALLIGPLGRIPVAASPAASDLTALTLGEAAKQIASRRVSPVDLCEAYLTRIAQPISIPAGADAAGLPIGLQLVARTHRDALLLGFAGAFARGGS